MRSPMPTVSPSFAWRSAAANHARICAFGSGTLLHPTNIAAQAAAQMINAAVAVSVLGIGRW